MTALKATPGPWKVSHSGFERTPHIHTRVGGKPRTIARLIKADDWEANANLIAASPDLYEACEAAERAITDIYPLNAEPPIGHPLQKLRAALLRARGEEQS